MPFFKTISKYGQCPYCYEGYLAYDKYSGHIYCERCSFVVKIRYYKNPDDHHKITAMEIKHYDDLER